MSLFASRSRWMSPGTCAGRHSDGSVAAAGVTAGIWRNSQPESSATTPFCSCADRFINAMQENKRTSAGPRYRGCQDDMLQTPDFFVYTSIFQTGVSPIHTPPARANTYGAGQIDNAEKCKRITRSVVFLGMGSCQYIAGAHPSGHAAFQSRKNPPLYTGFTRKQLR